MCGREPRQGTPVSQGLHSKIIIRGSDATRPGKRKVNVARAPLLHDSLSFSVGQGAGVFSNTLVYFSKQNGSL